MTDTTGRNVPAYDPDAIDELKRDAERLTEEIEGWRDKDVDSEETAETLRDLLARAQAVGNKAEKRRVADKDPYLQAEREIDAAYSPIKGRIKKLVERCKDKLQPWLDRKAAEKREAERVAREEAEAAKREADRQAALAQKARSIEAEEAAEAAAKRAAEATKRADKTARSKVGVGSASGGAKTLSTRKRRVAYLTDINQAFVHYRDSRHRQEIVDLLTRLANAEVRAKDGPSKVPGFDVREERTL